MATISGTPRPAYIYDAANSQWVPVGFGPHTHAVTDVTNAFNTTTVTAKGDLVVAAGSNSVTKLPVGVNGDILVPDSSTTTGLRWQGLQAAGKNYFVNGGFDFWQRGTSFTTPGGAYTADRFKATVNGTATYTISRQLSGLTGTQYCLRFQRTSGQTYTDGSFVGYAWETESMIGLQGKTVTYSFYARVGSNWSPLGGIGVQLQQGTGAGTHAFSALTGETSAFTGTASGLTTSWQRFSFTGTLSSTATELRTNLSFSPVGTAGANDYIELTGFQLELGSVATPFSRAGGTIAGELAACQRYYYRQTAGSAYGWMAYGGCQNTVNGQAGLVLPVQMRTVPTALEYANLRVVDSSYAGTLTSLALNTGESTPNVADIYVTASGITGGRPLYIGANNNAGAYIAVTAEL